MIEKPSTTYRRLTVAVMAVLLVALGVTQVSAIDPINTTFFGNLAIAGYDPVAYFTDGKPVKGKKEHTLEWNGARWRFASGEHLQLFRESPEQYAPQYGGYCAWAVSQGDTADIDPEQWQIVDGKLYLNYNREIQERWQQDIEGHIAAADRHWPELLRK